MRAALAQSGALIILCSPNSAGSLWVAEEIETFRELHPDRPILAAVLDGDPPDCFPAALRAFGRDGTWHEPLATDLRPNGDGEAAGPPEAGRRHHRGGARRARPARCGATGPPRDGGHGGGGDRDANHGGIGGGRAQGPPRSGAPARRGGRAGRVHADRSAEQAERASAGIDIMQAVNRRALRYYGGQRRLGGLPADSLRRRARVLHAIGEDEMTRGDLPAALAAFREAHRTTAEQLARAPERSRAHLSIMARANIGSAASTSCGANGRPRDASYARYAAAAERLLALDPANPEYMMSGGLRRAVDLGNIRAQRQRKLSRRARRLLRDGGGPVRARRPRADPADRDAPRPAGRRLWLARPTASTCARCGANRWRRGSRQYRIAERLHRAQPDNAGVQPSGFALARGAVASRTSPGRATRRLPGPGCSQPMAGRTA